MMKVLLMVLILVAVMLIGPAVSADPILVLRCRHFDEGCTVYSLSGINGIPAHHVPASDGSAVINLADVQPGSYTVNVGKCVSSHIDREHGIVYGEPSCDSWATHQVYIPPERERREGMRIELPVR